MVYCAHCGTQNRDGSKFCNNCGARLVPESGLRCPMCSTPNPVESVFCVNCGARLVPLTAASLPETKQPAPPIKGLSLPAKPVIPAEEPTPEPAAAPAESAKPDVSDSSEWLDQLRTAESTSQGEPSETKAEPLRAEPPASEEANIPDWLTRLRAAAPQETPAEPTPDESIPDWLRTPPPESEKAPIEPAAEEEIPDWLKQARTEPAGESPSISVAEEELPDWLRQPVASTPTPTEEKTVAPDWLTQPVVEKTEPEKETPAQVPAPAEPQPIGPIKPAEPAEPQAIEPTKPAEPLLETLEAAEVSALEPAELPVRPAPGRAEEDEIPDWLRTATAAQSPVAPAKEIEPPQPGQVPAWVAALKPAETPPTAGLATDEVEKIGPLEGLRGVLPLAVAIAEPHPPVQAPKPAEPSEGGQIFESIMAMPTPVAASAAKPTRRALTMRPFIYLLLFVAVLVPFILPADLTQSTFKIAGVPAEGFFETVQTIPANSTVLLSFDYDPSLSGEMDLSAKAVARDLARHGVKIVAVSTLETGPQIAQRILGEVAQEVGNYTYGSNYLIVYLPGHEAGLSLLASGALPTATDFVGQKPVAPFLTSANIRTTRDFPIAIEFAGSEDSLRAWVEQVQPRTGLRIAAAVSAAVEPKARAYLSANQLTAMMAGLLGAAQYEALSSQPGLAVISVNAQTAAQLVLVFVVILGNVVFWISRARGAAK